MRHTRWWIAAVLVASTAAHATDLLRDPGEVKDLLAGKTLYGVYLGTGSEYQLRFGADGALANSSGAEGRWWTNDQGQYCRKWETGRLAGHEACLDLSREGDTLVIHSRGKRVAEGVLREQ